MSGDALSRALRDIAESVTAGAHLGTLVAETPSKFRIVRCFDDGTRTRSQVVLIRGDASADQVELAQRACAQLNGRPRGGAVWFVMVAPDLDAAETVIRLGGLGALSRGAQ